MDRRSFVKSAAATSAASFAFGSGLFDGGARAQSAQENHAIQDTKPNILVIEVDQLRFPTVFPPGIDSVDQFLQLFMPNLHQLWRNGVKFAGHYTAACACTPARGTIITGLYSQQSWLVSTILAKPDNKLSPQPWLNPAFPTYGKLLRSIGYQTPYVGKWHVSIPPPNAPRLEAYGFDGLSYYDPTGANLQGTYGDEAHGYHNDQYIVNQAVQWLQAHDQDEAPWCLTVSFINPHDKEFFWAGTEFQTYNKLFSTQTAYQPFTLYSTSSNPPQVSWAENALREPPHYGYLSVPPNWETAAQLAANKPSTQTFSRLFQELVWGGAADDATEHDFSLAPYPPASYQRIPDNPYAVGIAPFSYWQRSLNSYAQIMTVVDGAIGQVMQAFVQLPASVRNNTVIVFTSDHGEYAGAHGFLSGKVGALYDEAYHVPLIVVDPLGRFTSDIDTPRQGLTSSVDVLPLLVSLAVGGSRAWLTGYLGRIYGSRHDLLPMLRSSQAPGRQYVLLATDESVPGYFNFNGSPTHLVGIRSQGMKFCIYADWIRPTTRIADNKTLETELYDYSTPGGVAEIDNLKNDPRIPALRHSLINNIIPNELRGTLPGVLGVAQDVSRTAYLAYDTVIRNLPATKPGTGTLQTVLPFGMDF
jgi:arylsulfatase A-like enzyme